MSTDDIPPEFQHAVRQTHDLAEMEEIAAEVWRRYDDAMRHGLSRAVKHEQDRVDRAAEIRLKERRDPPA